MYIANFQFVVAFFFKNGGCLTYFLYNQSNLETLICILKKTVHLMGKPLLSMHFATKTINYDTGRKALSIKISLKLTVITNLKEKSQWANECPSKQLTMRVSSTRKYQVKENVSVLAECWVNIWHSLCLKLIREVKWKYRVLKFDFFTFNVAKNVY